MLRGLFLIIACGGCALTTWEAQVPSVAVQARAEAPGAIIVRGIVDRRDNHRIGIKKNGWGQITADVVSTSEVADLLRESLMKSLSASGLNVVAQSPQAWTADGEILQFVAEPDVGAWTIDIFAEAAVRVQLAAPDGGVYLRTFVGHGAKEGIFIPSENDYVEALHGALEDVMRQIVTAMGQLVARNGAGA